MTGWQNKPFVIDVKAGETKVFCMCGLSKNGPYCDGSHKTTDIKPQVVTFEEDKRIFVCGCRQSAKKPYCDGTHKNIKVGSNGKAPVATAPAKES